MARPADHADGLRPGRDPVASVRGRARHDALLRPRARALDHPHLQRRDPRHSDRGPDLLGLLRTAAARH